MVVNLIQQSKRQRNLIYGLGILILLALVYYSYQYFVSSLSLKVVTPGPTVYKKIELDFKILENPFFETLVPYQKISLPPAEKIGRTNPFERY